MNKLLWSLTMKKKKVIKFPAQFIVHWPSGPVKACHKHAQSLIGMGKILGSHIVASEIDDTKTYECINCVNEAKVTND